MSKRRIFIFGIVTAVLVWLVYLQVRQWRRFEWHKFWRQTAEVQQHWWLVLAAVVLIYAADTLRGIRWAIFLRPVKRVESRTLIAPQFIGFAALALLGRLGELVRPYIIARRTEQTLASQMAVWTVERIFDVSAVTCLLAFAIFFSPAVRRLHDYRLIRNAGAAVIGVIAIGIFLALIIRKHGSRLAHWIEEKYKRRFPALTANICKRIHSFSAGLNTIHDARSFITLALLSIVIWSMVAGSYRFVTNAYRAPLDEFGFASVILLMFASIAGGIVQLPGVGGGSQLVTIATLISVFGIEKELAISCGILLWLVTFMSVIPLGLVLAHRERLSLRQLVIEEEAELVHGGGGAG